MKQLQRDWIACVAILLPVIYLGAIYSSLPQTVPVHWDLRQNRRLGRQKHVVAHDIIIAGIDLCHFLFCNQGRSEKGNQKQHTTSKIENPAYGINVAAVLLYYLFGKIAKNQFAALRHHRVGIHHNGQLHVLHKTELFYRHPYAVDAGE